MRTRRFPCVPRYPDHRSGRNDIPLTHQDCAQMTIQTLYPAMLQHYMVAITPVPKTHRFHHGGQHGVYLFVTTCKVDAVMKTGAAVDRVCAVTISGIDRQKVERQTHAQPVMQQRQQHAVPYIHKNIKDRLLFPNVLHCNRIHHNRLRSLLLNENGDVSVGAADGIGVVRGQDWCLSFRLLTDNYLRYKSVISRKCTTEVVVSKEALHDSIRRVLLMGDGIQRTVRMVTDTEKLVLSTVDRIQRKSAEEEVACLSSGPAVSIYLDGEGVCKMLQQFSSEKVVLKMKDASSPMLIVPEQKAEKEDFLMLIAPSWQ